ncbi:type I 3-dehydroquinate dehydratase [Chloroflexota bacterium]
MMNSPGICASIVSSDTELVKAVVSSVDLYEVRIDLIGDGWQELAGQLKKPWIACNRRAEEGGSWRGSETARIAELTRAVEMGADMVDIEMETEDLAAVVRMVKQRTQCLLSHHDLRETPSLDKMRKIVERQLAAGADVCKVVTTARTLGDNLAVLQLVKEFPGSRVVSFAMGALGVTSRVLCPLVGGDFTYASLAEGREAAPGQLTVGDLRKIYGMLDDGK